MLERRQWCRPSTVSVAKLTNLGPTLTVTSVYGSGTSSPFIERVGLLFCFFSLLQKVGYQCSRPQLSGAQDSVSLTHVQRDLDSSPRRLMT